LKKLIFLIMFAANLAMAQQDPVLALRDASQRIEAASAALVAAEASEDRIGALSVAIRSLEEGLASLRLALQASKSEETAKQAELTGNRAELGRLLATLISLQNTPAALAVLHPEGATASARAGAMLSSLTPALRAEANQLRGEIATILALNSLHDNALANMQTALGTLQNARNALTVAIREEQPDGDNPVSDAGLSQLAQASQDLNTLAAALKARFPTGVELPETGDLRGRLPMPIIGTITRRFNAPNGAGIRQPGIVITAPALSLVSAPQAGIVRFSGDFLEYGQVVILEPAPNQLQIYAGFGQVYVKAGEVLESGAAMGLLGGEMPDSA
jgi:septal ring factor EnvC (AmiA/AmiB activator)